jgi:hypothetical protein
MEETIKTLMDQAIPQAFLLKTIQDDPALQDLATRVVTEALTQTLRRLEE